MASIFTLGELFQSTPPRGGRLIASSICSQGIVFQSTPPRGGRPSLAVYSLLIAHFNPRPREGGDLFVCDKLAFHKISIHAPARGATMEISLLDLFSMISIHAPARGATAGDICVFISTLFQSTPPRGGRRRINATQSKKRNFNPRPREGGDSKDAQFYLRIFDKQVELLRFWGKMRGGCLRNPEKDRRFLGKSLANLPEISGHLDFAGA